jgi:hypothetical protein
MKDKNISRLHSILVPFILLLFTMNVTAQGQNNKFTKQELTNFIHAVKKVIPIQKEGQEKMAIKIRKSDFTVKEYNDILSKMQKKKDVDLPRKRVQAFNVLAAEVQKIQEEYHLKIAHELNNEGLTMDKYDEILVAYQKDSEVKTRINKLMQANN